MTMVLSLSKVAAVPTFQVHTMSSLTPQSRAAEATEAATWEGYINGALTLIPTSGLMYILLQKPEFVKRTNWQSRTALVIMPALFVFAFTSETRLTHKMREIAEESRHQDQTVRWAEKKLSSDDNDLVDAETQLTQLYMQSIEQSGVNIVPGDKLSFYHVAANYTAANPIKVLAALAVPSVAWIFRGRAGKEHLDFSVKLLHTRVFGQFATLSLLLGVMGFKEFMDQNGTPSKSVVCQPCETSTSCSLA